ncbi:PREDICTED: uncharacterized protein LOC109192836 [Ipomoea nil]|uniref:uncharacterized protein LOC109192836 n=1 Tax=Ipomoea nil TaxID=35883 RepID=UPI0009016670|nr:PREDICTED: uncharacterized protein LOC109192836 [Ipomoea nil]
MATSAEGGGVEGVTWQWADLVIAAEEERFEPVLDGVDDAPVDAQPVWSLVGRFLTRKLVKLEFMREVLALVWQSVQGVQVTEIQPRLFLFVFFHKTDMERILNDGPWAYENATLVCRQVVDGMRPEDVVLDTVDMWVQVHGLPMGHTSEKILEQVGNYLGGFVKFDDRLLNVPWKAFYRIRVAIPVDKPIKRRMNFVKRDKSTCWVSFKYERLHNFCFYCG